MSTDAEHPPRIMVWSERYGDYVLLTDPDSIAAVAKHLVATEICEFETRAKSAEYLAATLMRANERLRSGLAALQAMANEVTEFAAEVSVDSEPRAPTDSGGVDK